jgi:hypothetical protein
VKNERKSIAWSFFSFASNTAALCSSVIEGLGPPTARSGKPVVTMSCHFSGSSSLIAPGMDSDPFGVQSTERLRK